MYECLELAIFMWSLEIEVTFVIPVFQLRTRIPSIATLTSTKMPYKLSATLTAHTSDVRQNMFVDYTPLTRLLITGARTEFSNKRTHLVGFPRYYCDLLATITIKLAVSSRDSSASWLPLYQLRCLYSSNSRGAKR